LQAKFLDRLQIEFAAGLKAKLTSADALRHAATVVGATAEAKIKACPQDKQFIQDALWEVCAALREQLRQSAELLKKEKG
jgi:hypothetical protein